jgi:hypothetical protein
MGDHADFLTPMGDDLETELNKIICTQIGVFPFSLWFCVHV